LGKERRSVLGLVVVVEEMDADGVGTCWTTGDSNAAGIPAKFRDVLLYELEKLLLVKQTKV
jgi:hypothetical protein